MCDQISWHVVPAIKQDQLDNFQALTREMVDFTRTESGVLCYQRFASEDGKFVHGYERYADSAAALAHLRNFATLFSERLSALVDRERFTVFGQPSRELWAVLDCFGAIYLRPFGDLAYYSDSTINPTLAWQSPRFSFLFTHLFSFPLSSRSG